MFDKEAAIAAEMEVFVEQWKANSLNRHKVYSLLFLEDGRERQVAVETGYLTKAAGALRLLEPVAGLVQTVDSVRDYLAARDQWIAHDQARLVRVKAGLKELGGGR